MTEALAEDMRWRGRRSCPVELWLARGTPGVNRCSDGLHRADQVAHPGTVRQYTSSIKMWANSPFRPML